MASLLLLAAGVALLVAALVKAGSSRVTWLLFRLRLGRLLTAGVALLLIWGALANLIRGTGADH